MAKKARSPAWRPLPGRGPDPAPLGQMLDRAVRSLGSPTSAAGVETIFERWSDVVGEAMAARTRPVHIDGDTLVVGCDEPAVATHVRFLQAQLVERLAELTGERRLCRIEVRVDRARRGPRPPRPPVGRSGRSH